MRIVTGFMILFGLLASVTGCAFGEPKDEQAGSPPTFPSSAKPTTPSGDPAGATSEIAKDMSVPWGMGFLPDGTALVAERDTKKIIALKLPKYAKKTVATIDEARAGGEGGLLGLAVSPKYETDKTIMIYYSTSTDNRIAKLVLGQRPQPVVTGIPKSGVHNGGRIAFGPDGFLYAGTGDGSSGPNSQNKTNLGGKILRVTIDGQGAPGNPFPESPLVYSYGHRNVQGLAWDDQKRLWATEFGQNQWDEINLIKSGGNYGWPTVEGTAKRPEFIDPVVTWKPADASCSGVAYHSHTLVAACLRGAKLWLVPLTGQGGTAGTPTPALPNVYGRLRTVENAPDGTLWITTSNKDGRGKPNSGDDKIIRVVLTGAGGVSAA